MIVLIVLIVLQGKSNKGIDRAGLICLSGEESLLSTGGQEEALGTLVALADELSLHLI
jgi:hypothetical protein